MGSALPPGDRVRIVGWNCNSLSKYSNQIRFVSKIRKMDGDIFVLCDTRLRPSDEGPFKKLWGETVLFNSHSGDKRSMFVIMIMTTMLVMIMMNRIMIMIRS